MQIVIEISNTLKDIADNEDAKKFSNIVWQALLMDAIKNGQPLPKGHGRLIDTNEITAFMELECNGHNVESLDEFTVIIEADGGNI